MDVTAIWASKDFWVPIVAGCGLIALGVVQLVKYRQFRRRAEHTQGLVVDLEVGMTAQAGHAHYHPVLEFTTRAGRRVRATTRVGGWPAPADVGDTVLVTYDPTDPEEVEVVGTECTRLALVYLLLVLGLVFVGVAWV